MTAAEFLAVQQGQSTKLNSGGRPAQYRPFCNLLNGEQHDDAYQYSRDLKIRFKSHVLPETHRLFTIIARRELICWELHGPPPLERARCCGQWFFQIPAGDHVDELRYVSDHERLRRHRRKCVGRLVRERPQGLRRPRRVPHRDSSGLRSPFPGGRKGAVITDESDWGSSYERIPLLGVNATRVPKTCESQKDSAS